MKKQHTSRHPGSVSWLLGLLAITGLPVLLGCGQTSEREIHQREMIAGGRASYQAYCEGCHGRTAKGDGPTAKFMKIPPADLTQLSKRNGGTFPAESISRRIDGSERETTATTSESTKMPHWGRIWRGTDDDQEAAKESRERLAELVEYLRSIQE